jgi:hypothetical protein
MIVPQVNGGVNKHRFVWLRTQSKSVITDSRHLRALASDAAGKLDVLGHDCHTFGVDSSKIGILEKTYEVSLGGFLKGKNS